MTQVKAGQTAAARQHVVHVGHFSRTQLAQVDALETAAVVEHVCHVGHLRGVEVGDACQRGQAGQIVKPFVGGGGIIGGE